MKKITIPQEIRFQISEKFLCAFFFFFFFFIFVMWKLCMKSFHRLSMCVSIYGYNDIKSSRQTWHSTAADSFSNKWIWCLENSLENRLETMSWYDMHFIWIWWRNSLKMLKMKINLRFSWLYRKTEPNGQRHNDSLNNPIISVLFLDEYFTLPIFKR